MYKYKFLLALIILFQISSCKHGAQEDEYEMEMHVYEEKKHEIKEVDLINPILKLSVIIIPSEGVIDNLSGEVFLKKKGDDQYIKVRPHDTINFKDILELRKGANVKMKFPDGRYITIDPVDKDTWFTFEFIDAP